MTHVFSGQSVGFVCVKIAETSKATVTAEPAELYGMLAGFAKPVAVNDVEQSSADAAIVMM